MTSPVAAEEEVEQYYEDEEGFVEEEETQGTIRIENDEEVSYVTEFDEETADNYGGNLYMRYHRITVDGMTTDRSLLGELTVYPGILFTLKVMEDTGPFGPSYYFDLSITEEEEKRRGIDPNPHKVRCLLCNRGMVHKH